MYHNIGEKIQNFSKICFLLGVVISLILAITTSIAMSDLGSGGAGALFFIIIMAVGIVTSYISFLFTYAFGTLVSDVTFIKQHLNRHNS